MPCSIAALSTANASTSVGWRPSSFFTPYFIPNCTVPRQSLAVKSRPNSSFFPAHASPAVIRRSTRIRNVILLIIRQAVVKRERKRFFIVFLAVREISLSEPQLFIIWLTMHRDVMEIEHDSPLFHLLKDLPLRLSDLTNTIRTI